MLIIAAISNIDDLNDGIGVISTKLVFKIKYPYP